MIARKTSSISIDSVHSTRSPCSSVGDCDADDEGTVSMDESKAKPLSVVIPTIPAAECPRRPSLQEILANNSPAPWTLTAFMAYLSNNHCLETLEFTMDAGRYKKHYQRMMNKAPAPGEPAPEDAIYVKDLWTRLIEAYIQPNGSREVNLPSEVRDPIIHLSSSDLPPQPEILDLAVAKTYELMEESVLASFLNSVYFRTSTSAMVAPFSNSNESVSAYPCEEKSRFRRRHNSSRSSPPPQGRGSGLGSFDGSRPTPPAMPNRKSAPSALTTALAKHRFSTKLSPTGAQPPCSLTTAMSATSSCSDNVTSGPGLTDDSGSSGSPPNDSPMTPPVTPHMSELGSSPRTSRDSGAWKKLGRLSGWKPGRKRSQGFKDQEPQ